MRVLTIGETMGLAVTPCGEPFATAPDARLHTAGAESTVAIGLRRLGIEVAWAGVVGADEVGARVLRDARAEGVDVRHARIDAEATTGFMLRELRTAQLTRVTYYREGSAGSRLCPADVEAAFEGFEPDLLHLTGITAALSDTACEAVLRAVELASASGAEVSLDVNHRPSLPRGASAAGVTRSLLPRVDVLFVGDDELSVVTDQTDVGRAAAALQAAGPREVVVKQGAAGATARLGDAVEHVDAMLVDVLDVIGAGDSFVAGYLAARADGAAVAERLRWGTICAAFTVGTHGDWEGLPTRAELQRFAASAVTVR